MKFRNSQRHIHRKELSTQLTQVGSVLTINMNKYAAMGLSEFEEAVRKEMDENPALEEKEAWDEEVVAETYDGEDVEEAAPQEKFNDIGRDEDYDSGRDDVPYDDDGLDLSDYTVFEPHGGADFQTDAEAVNQQTFYESLLEQLNGYDLSEEDAGIMKFLISSLDSNGYLNKELIDIVYELNFKQYIDTTEEHVARLLSLLQSFDPIGLGARNLQECLLLQVKALPPEHPLREVAILALTEYFESFVNLEWQRLRRRLKLKTEDFEALRRLLKHLNPKPGNQLNVGLEDEAPIVVPDVYVELNTDGEPVVTLNNGTLPDLCVSPAYLETLKHYSAHRTQLSNEMKAQLIFVQSKVDAARGFINVVTLRQTALRSVTETLVELQRDFFVNEDDETLLKPLKMEDVAKYLDIDTSTVSRVVRDKFMQTLFGVYPLKMLFASTFTAGDGVELTSHHAMLKLQEIVDGEDKLAPYSDHQLVAEMAKAGFPVARRTISKYRERLHIPEKRFRRKGQV